MTAASFRRRGARAAELAADRPAAGEMLALYGRVLVAQEALFATAGEWLPAEGAKAPTTFPGSLDWRELAGDLPGFAAAIEGNATEPLRSASQALAAADRGAIGSLLAAAAAREPAGAAATAVGAEEPPLAFWARAFLQPVAERYREAVGRWEEPSNGPSSRCPICAWPAQVGVLRDERTTRGRRRLVCGLCATRWPFPRVRCASCEEADPGKLRFHEIDGWDHLRVEECTTCGAYLKTVDLRRLGRAVPVVEDLASPEIDLWAVERGLWKVLPNLMGL